MPKVFARQNVVPDILAGLTLAAIGIPEVMGYTKIIGTPVVTGLYTLLIPALIFALLGSSRRLVVGADSATAAIVGSALMAMALPTGSEYLALASLVAFLAGMMLLLARVLRLGFLSNFLSQTVLVGFLTGVGLRVMLSQIPTMLHAVHVSELHLPTVFISLSVLILLASFERWAPRFPAPLLALVAVLIVGANLDFEQLGVKTLGPVATGLPHFSWPDLSFERISAVFSISFACFIVILAQSAATASAYAFRHQDSFDEDQDLLGLGFANITSALSGSFVVNGSPTRTAIVDSAGGSSQLAQVTSAVMALFTLLFLTRPLAHLPEAVLSAVVFMIGVKLVDHRGMKDIFLQSPLEFWLSTLTCATVVFIGVEQGILLALVLSLLNHVRRSYKPNTTVLCKDSQGHWMPKSLAQERQDIPGVVVYWFGADLFYANVTHFVSEVRRLVQDSPKPIRLLVIDAGAITGIDYTAAKHVLNLDQELRSKKIKVAWAHVSAGLRKDMKRHQLLNEDSLFETLRECLAALQVTYQ